MLLNGVEWYAKQPALLPEFLLNYSRNVLWYMKPESSYYPQQPARTPCSTSRIQSAICSADSFRSHLILCLHLCLGLWSDPSPSGFFFLAKTVCISYPSYEYYMARNMCTDTHNFARLSMGRMRIANCSSCALSASAHHFLPWRQSLLHSLRGLYISFTTNM